MSRVKLEFPSDNPLFLTEIPVRISDINYGGHVGNDAILSIVQEARVRLLASWGWKELDAAGAGLIMADAMVAYKGEGFYGDVLQVQLYATELARQGFDLLYRISCLRDGQVVEIAHVKTGMLCFDYDKRRICRVPEQLAERLSGSR
jgi:acyl-CoA thioesterase FadM